MMIDFKDPNNMTITILLAFIGWKLVEAWFKKVNKNLEHDQKNEVNLTAKLTRIELELEMIQKNTVGVSKINTDLSLLAAQYQSLSQEIANVRLNTGKIQTIENASDKAHLRLDDLSQRVKQLESKRDWATKEIENIQADCKAMHSRTHDLANLVNAVNLKWHLKNKEEESK